MIRLRIRPRILLVWIVRFLLALVFIYAAVVKMTAPQDFADSIAAYQILPPPAINIVALGLPVFEFTCGLLVLSGFYLRVGALGILTMLAIFSSALALALFRGLSIHCNCFGGISWLDAKPSMALLRDLILMGLALLVYTVRTESLPPESRSQPTSDT